MTATESTPAVTGVPFFLNGQALEANQGELLIDACERQGVHIPRFCYHERMKPVGMCRMCLVEVDTGRGPGLQPSCMLPVTPDMKVNTETEATERAQTGILELFLINHPLDCPVCDKGGECPLQDNAYSFGPGETRFVEEKRHYEKPIPISDLVNLDRERCILCDRCTRFSKEVAGDPLIHFIDRGNETQVNTFPDHPFSSYFSGNTVQICPVGALTATPYRFKARPWDLSATESTSTVDSTGARIVLQSSRDEMVRVLGVDSDAVNWGWLSDKERFGYEASNSCGRLTEPMEKSGTKEDGSNAYTSTRWNAAIGQAARALGVGADRIGVLGGARLSIEAQYAWSKLLTGVASVANIDADLGDGIDPQLALGLPRATIAEAVAPGSIVVLLSADPKEELPTLFLRLRHAAVEDGVSLIEITPRATSLTEHATLSIHPRPGSVGAVADALATGSFSGTVGGIEGSDLEAVAGLLRSGKPVTVIVGRSNLAESASFTSDAVASLLKLVPEAKFLPALRRGNLMGALEMGLTPSFDMGATPSSESGLDAEGILRAAADGQIETLLLLGSDPLSDFPDRALVTAAFENVQNLIAVDTFLNDSASCADVVLPAAGFGEVDGSFLNLEGRLSPLQAKVTPKGQSRTDWAIAAEVAGAVGADLGFATLEELRSDLSASVPLFADVDWTGLARTEDGPVLDATRDWSIAFGDRTDQPTIDGYGVTLVVDRKLWDLGTMVQRSATLAQLPEEATLAVSSSDFDKLGVNEGDMVTIDTGKVSVTLPIASNSGVPRGSGHVPYRLPGVDIGELLAADQLVTSVRVGRA